MTASASGPIVGATEIVFRLRLPADGVRSIRLHQEIRRPRNGPALRRAPLSHTWTARIPRPPVDRLEYQYEIEHLDGTRTFTLDPHNARRAPGPFGDKSVLELPGYRLPAWLDGDPALTPGDDPAPLDAEGGRLLDLRIDSDVLDAEVDLLLWSSPGLDVEHEAPLLVVHDGPEYARYSQLLELLAALVHADRVPPLRALLLPPIDRDDHYAASPLYARALAREILPLADWLAPQPPPRYDGRSWRIGVGASLGALALLHAHRRYPDAFSGLFLQSGSFFREATDRQESSFRHFDRIASFVDDVLAAETSRAPVPVRMTCGTVEENLANNRAVAAALARQGYDVDLVEHRDAHNWVGWRDALDPPLADLLQQAWPRLATA